MPSSHHRKAESSITHHVLLLCGERGARARGCPQRRSALVQPVRPAVSHSPAAPDAEQEDLTKLLRRRSTTGDPWMDATEVD